MNTYDSNICFNISGSRCCTATGTVSCNTAAFAQTIYYSNTCTIVTVLFERCRCLFTVITATQGLHTGATNISNSHFSQKSVTVHNALATRTSILHAMAADPAYHCYNIQTPHNKFSQIRQRLPSGCLLTYLKVT